MFGDFDFTGLDKDNENDPKRKKAIEELQSIGAPISEENIEQAIIDLGL